MSSTVDWGACRARVATTREVGMDGHVHTTAVYLLSRPYLCELPCRVVNARRPALLDVDSTAVDCARDSPDAASVERGGGASRL